MLLIKNATVHTPQGSQAGWDVLTEGTVIRELGPGLSAPGAEVIEATGMEVFPGMVLPLCSVGAVGFADDFAFWDKDETSEPILPQLDIRHAFDLRELRLQRLAMAGITSYGLSPGLKNLISGQISFVHIDGPDTAAVFLRERIALKGNFIRQVKTTFADKNISPQTHMAMFQLLDEAFRSAREYLDQGGSPYIEKQEVLGRVLRGEIPLLINAYSQNELESVMGLGDKHGFKPVLCGAYALDKCADEILKRQLHVVLGDAIFLSSGIEYQLDHLAIVELYRRGLQISLGGSADEGYPVGYETLLWNAALLRAAGASAREVLEMLTINPARALGMDSLVGSLEPGKQADFIICEGNPFQRYDGRVCHTMVAGRELYRREASPCC